MPCTTILRIHTSAIVSRFNEEICLASSNRDYSSFPVFRRSYSLLRDRHDKETEAKEYLDRL
mgnify:CR=1 FL=1